MEGWSRIIIFLSIALLPFALLGQQGEGDAPHTAESRRPEVRSLKAFFTQGRFHGHVRNYFMATTNEGALQDYWSNATGGAIHLETAEWKGITLGVGGIFTFQTYSSDLNEVDSLSQGSAKWEKELYDINRPEEKLDLDRMEALYIKYRFRKSTIAYGKMDLNKGPLLLRRDGRMKPFVYRGLWSEIHEWDKQKLTLGWLNGVSPRGMTEWFSMHEAIGILGNGRQPNGQKANYHEAAQTRGIGVLAYEYRKLEHFRFQFWNYHFHRLTHISWLQAEYHKGNHYLGLQYVAQAASPHQKKLEYENRYYQPNEHAHIISTKVGHLFSKRGLDVSGAYLHGFGTGRFLYPKELGRENFYVSQPRSWMDGFGAMDVYMLRAQWKPKAKGWDHLSLDFSASYLDAPPADDFRHNKYGKSSYWQNTLLMDYHFGKVLEGLKLTFLYVGISSLGNENLSPAETFYRTDLHHYNLIVNLDF